MSRQHRLIALVAGAAGALALVTPASAAAPTATATFDATTDISPQLVGGETSPAGTAKFTQVGPKVVMNAAITGLRPFTQYVVVPYKDGACIPAAGITAFPSPFFTTDNVGSAKLVNYAINPAGINPLGALSVPEINSVSIRQVVITVLGFTIPDASQTEACDTTVIH